MQEPLFKLLKKKSAKVEVVSAVQIQYEELHKDWFKPVVQLLSDEYEIGIEVEVENVNAHGCSEYATWQVHNDGSLRNHGYEYVTLPIKGKRIHFSLNQFFATMEKTIVFSPRTSIHIHLNALDMTPKQIAGFIITYLPFEKLLYRFVGGSRDKSNFCVPLADTGFTGLLDYFTDEMMERFRTPNLPNHRYMGLNVDALRKYGSLEFRHLGGTADVAKILRWINLLFALKKYATSNDFETIKAKICKLNTDSAYMIFLDQVFGPCAWYLSSGNLQKEMEGAVSLIKALTVENKFKEKLALTGGKDNEWYTRLMRKDKTNFMIFGNGLKVKRRRDVPIQPREAREAPQPGNWREAARVPVGDWFEQMVVPAVVPQIQPGGVLFGLEANPAGDLDDYLGDEEL